ncbi:Hsp20/alpha crystallin family protein [Leptothermofonsia sp. ETS-13]|uniref:Hsp20/alpha crystallin family protein n=1 Tax=Leptothermofonsia sp. ETS-13 TaxID=3035696 RepID=UPI003BA2DB1B
MAIIRWQPWQEMETLRQQMDQLFDEFVPVTRGASFSNGNRNAWAPAIELKSTDTELVLRAELPGINAQDLDIQVSREAVSISGEYKTKTESKEGRVIRSEFRYGSFHRVIPLPVAIRNNEVKAELKDGILTLSLPKFEADRPKVVKVNLSGVATEPALEASSNGKSQTVTEPAEGDVWAEVTKNS